ncbi:trypsin-like peptidase domain-containing protein [Amycolatopsis acidiphila]|uniref:Trypsin-like serine protease n=1 Tax=Amycolatopsis acidiphila TaxID=715473 RepID=A0A558A6F4_9PSEU|nr:trypsin-like peptidase domain-containing protein [Amycolatopsis acidiphila]TVT19825.1 trypsin-like serine protease [Amycolatopsis acidiphila]UIJ58729.1 trypsin-like peptidase domain-containing protein [Amycolatopsis acidiphila]
MSENDFRPGHAGGYQPQQQSHPYYGQQQPNPAVQVLAPPPRRKGKRVAVLISATAVAAALVGGASGAAIVGFESGSAAAPTSTTAAQTVSGSTNTDVSAVAAKVLPSVVEVNVTTSQGEAIGSGVILSSDGKILTNAHVVSDAGSVTVTLSDGTKYQASVLGADTTADIAVLQAKGASGLTAATLGDSSQLQVGQEVVAIGSPAGLQNTVTSGIVSALNRQLSDIGTGDGQQSSPFGQTADQTSGSPSYTAIQTDAAINQGNSGGALVNMAGQVIGINSALYSPSSSAGSVGIGFAIPINDAKTIVSQIEND